MITRREAICRRYWIHSILVRRLKFEVHWVRSCISVMAAGRLVLTQDALVGSSPWLVVLVSHLSISWSALLPWTLLIGLRCGSYMPTRPRRKFCCVRNSSSWKRRAMVESRYGMFHYLDTKYGRVVL